MLKCYVARFAAWFCICVVLRMRNGKFCCRLAVISQGHRLSSGSASSKQQHPQLPIIPLMIYTELLITTVFHRAQEEGAQ